jgi:hypothetical protein
MLGSRGNCLKPERKVKNFPRSGQEFDKVFCQFVVLLKPSYAAKHIKTGAPSARLDGKTSSNEVEHIVVLFSHARKWSPARYSSTGTNIDKRLRPESHT